MKWGMSAQELADDRRAAGYSTDELATLLQVAPARVAAWEAGSTRIPFRHVRKMRWWLAVGASAKALEAAKDLPECEWATRFERRPKPRGPEEEERFDEEWDAHTESCHAVRRGMRSRTNDIRSRPIPSRSG